MTNYRVWYSTESFADYIIDNTVLKDMSITKSKLYESDANNSKRFHTLPDHIKKILYLDAPDLIVEIDQEPVFSIEISTEAGTGHNAFQRFARIAASVENYVPSFYIYPEATIITRRNSRPKWDKINPLVFKALDDIMSIYNIPALLFYFPTDFKHYSNSENSPNISQKGLLYETSYKYAGCPNKQNSEMQSMFSIINDILDITETRGVANSKDRLLGVRNVINRRAYMQNEYSEKKGNLRMSPLSATVKIPTTYILKYLSKYETNKYKIGELIKSRKETIIYKINAKFRGDPYPGALAAIDYLLCREGITFEERKYNLILAWGEVNIDDKNNTIGLSNSKSTINDFISAVQASENKNILSKKYEELKNDEISRYYMQVRYGSTYSKAKHIRIYSYFADAILFPDGSLWRDA